MCKGAIEGVLFVMMGVEKKGFLTEVGILIKLSLFFNMKKRQVERTVEKVLDKHLTPLQN